MTSQTSLQKNLNRAHSAASARLGKIEALKLSIALAETPAEAQVHRASLKKAIGRYLKSMHCRFAAADRANRKLPKSERNSLSDVRSVAESIKVHSASTEPIRVFFKKKLNGKRSICVFGFERKVRHELVRPILDQLFCPKPWQFTHRGVPKAIRYIQELDLTAGTAVAALDISNFFGSFDRKSLGGVVSAIPSTVRRMTLLHEEAPLVYMNGANLSGVHSGKARRGIAQGSAVSPLVAAIAVSQINWEPAQGVIVVNYSDDFLIVAPTKEEVEASIFALKTAIAVSLGDAFNLKTKAISTLGEGITFLGHSLQFEDDVLVTVPAPGAYTRIRQDIKLIQQEAANSINRYKTKNALSDRKKAVWHMARLVARYQNWQRAFQQCTEDAIDPVKQDVAWRLEELLKVSGFTLDEVEKKLPEAKHHADMSGSGE